MRTTAFFAASAAIFISVSAAPTYGDKTSSAAPAATTAPCKRGLVATVGGILGNNVVDCNADSNSVGNSNEILGDVDILRRGYGGSKTTSLTAAPAKTSSAAAATGTACKRGLVASVGGVASGNTIDCNLDGNTVASGNDILGSVSILKRDVVLDLGDILSTNDISNNLDSNSIGNNNDVGKTVSIARGLVADLGSVLSGNDISNNGNANQIGNSNDVLGDVDVSPTVDVPITVGTLLGAEVDLGLGLELDV